MIAPFLFYSLYLSIFELANVKMFSVLAILEYLLLLEALKDSKIPYLFLTDLVSAQFHRSKKNASLSLPPYFTEYQYGTLFDIKINPGGLLRFCFFLKCC